MENGPVVTPTTVESLASYSLASGVVDAIPDVCDGLVCCARARGRV